MNITENFSDVKVLVIGDVMLDRYWWGTVDRISPEAPVPVVSLNRTSLVAGGAANVAANVAGLGAIPFLIGITGDDADAKLFAGVLKDANITNFKLFKLKGRKSTVKTRIIAHNQQVVRLDQETSSELTSSEAAGLFDEIRPYFDEIDIVIISDYAKGFLTDDLVRNLIGYANKQNKMILADPKGKDYSKYAFATLLTPNQREAADACGIEHNSVNLVERSGDFLLEKLSLMALLITQGEKGMTLLEKGKVPEYLQAMARTVYDVTGAGDTAIATMAIALGCGTGFLRAAEIANLAAGLVVETVGTTPVTMDMIRSYAADH
ncbi:MAG: D-glycero-beta-D-manno-heptose-7-phosphate kinase [Saprospiraceae bacterium]|nr:D-glycero-beta-D-manno-heptose-7-phosphate kinase [Pyrinomonadaceae bacterium]